MDSMSKSQLLLDQAARETRSYLDAQMFDPWHNTPYEKYRFVGNKQKGAWGEQIASRIFEKMGCEVEPPTNTGHDRIIDGKKVEMKFSLAQMNSKTQEIQNDLFMMNHVSEDKDWEYLLFIGVNDVQSNIEFRRMVLSKSKFVELIRDENQPFFKRQQGGAKIKNDDWICNGKNLINLIESDHVESLENWKEIIS